MQNTEHPAQTLRRDRAAKHDPETCGIYTRPMTCEACGKATDSLGTDHADWLHKCWPCLGALNVGARLHELNRQRAPK